MDLSLSWAKNEWSDLFWTVQRVVGSLPVLIQAISSAIWVQELSILLGSRPGRAHVGLQATWEVGCRDRCPPKVARNAPMNNLV